MSLRSKRTSPLIVEIEGLRGLLQRQESLHDCVLQGLDLREAAVDWSQVEVEGAIFLGCRFRTLEDELLVRGRGATVFPRLDRLPYDPYRSRLYTWRDLLEGWSPERDDSLDLRIYRHFMAEGRHLAGIREALAQRIHDHAIDDALQDYLDFSPQGLPRRRAVGLMGGHGTPRGHEDYIRVARSARRLSRAGYLVVTGGGPGIMEAGNLGAYLANRTESELGEAIDRLSAAPTYGDEGYLAASFEVLARFPRGEESLAVPTWFYGHEPTNLFASAIAKYFSNSLREDGLLALCVYGIVFAPGSAGTTQEVFQDAGQNHYSTFGYRSPMVFLGRRRYAEETGIFSLLFALAKERGYEHLLHLTDSPREAARFIREHPPEVGSDES